ncbi:PREDICTED: ATP-dependent DNA helicase PIF1-like [Erythranthe guttata]|uniref:ATP-dependent DNA helicase PIF1-like n=1 Tax=Erythranthe guttata TaxID=4155 RepID=UPI00064DDFEB|nr:PREDICTED: ATP-dependent DNA helicase PIF1-like [Erythranthe guttata]|eukprot:XP_012846883.1 PREDICTED: ATP-dependent DNA helicase PIF1-like [Erythranthe guttata]
MNRDDANAIRLHLLYKEFPEYFVWEGVKRKWMLRKRQTVVGRLCTVNPQEGERYFERLLLAKVRCPVSFDDLLSVDGQQCSTFRESAIRRGILQSDEYVDNCMAEAVLFHVPYCLHILFALVLVYGSTSDTQLLWDKYYFSLSEDFSHDTSLGEKDVLLKTVTTIDLILISMDKSISDYAIKFPFGYLPSTDRLSADYRHERSIIISDEDMARSFFLDGQGGTSKTFLYRALLTYVRSRGNIALAVATSGVAASLLPGGRTTHSRFNLPFDIDDKPIGKVSKQNSLGKMIVEARLIIWDEATMANRHSVESLDDVLRHLCDASLPFGGKLVLLGGDFRKTLPVVVRSSRESMVGACITISHIWCNVIRLELSENMRARQDPNFIAFLLRVGDGVEPVIFDDNIHIPNEMLIPFVDSEVSFGCLVDSVYPSFDTLSANPYALVNRAILTPINECVDYINDLLIDRFTGQVKEYISFNKTTNEMKQAEYEDYLNGVSASGLPLHVLRLKENFPIMLLRNLDPVRGLCNGTRLICRQLGDNFIKAEIATGDFKGDHVFIPRIPLESSSKLECPIPFRRLQIPVRLCFAMTINKSQGQTLGFVGIYLREPVFSHSQLYVALLRAKSAEFIKILIEPSTKK